MSKLLVDGLEHLINDEPLTLVVFFAIFIVQVFLTQHLTPKPKDWLITCLKVLIVIGCVLSNIGPLPNRIVFILSAVGTPFIRSRALASPIEIILGVVLVIVRGLYLMYEHGRI